MCGSYEQHSPWRRWHFISTAKYTSRLSHLPLYSKQFGKYLYFLFVYVIVKAAGTGDYSVHINALSYLTLQWRASELSLFNMHHSSLPLCSTGPIIISATVNMCVLSGMFSGYCNAFHYFTNITERIWLWKQCWNMGLHSSLQHHCISLCCNKETFSYYICSHEIFASYYSYY